MKSFQFLKATSLGAVLTAAIMIFAAPVHAQNVEGYIFGKVQTSTGVGTAATVTARSVDTGRSKTEATQADGTFRFSSLPTGNYEVSASATGYEGSAQRVIVNVGEGSGVTLFLAAADESIEEIVTTAKAIDTFNMTQSETTTVITTVDLDRLPIPRDPNAVALMAPGAVYGDSAFGTVTTRSSYGSNFGLASFGGASVGENTYFINGMNVTNFRNGLGGSTVPFEFFDQFQIKTGGYSAEFGRSTGGVVNAVTKRGTNDWQFKVGAYYEPDSFRGNPPNVADPSNPGEFDSVFANDERDTLEGFVSAGGPIIKDKLFVYGIYQLRDIQVDNYTGGGQLFQEDDSDPFWGAKIDWYINDNHSIELTGFSDEKEQVRTTFEWDEATDVVGDNLGQTLIKRGGSNYIFRYTGDLTENFTVSAMYGESEYDLTTAGPADSTCPAAYDSRGGGLTYLGCWTNLLPSSGNDSREIVRLDFEWELGDHLLRFGFDNEENTSVDQSNYSAGEYFRYFDAIPGDTLNNGGIVPDGVTEIIRYRRFFGGGDFLVKQEAMYIEDEWQVTDNINLRLGLRSETFDNRNAAGETFIKVDDQIAPRIGLVWDITGDGTSRLIANYGRYHLPIASNTNVRLSGAEDFTEAWHVLDSPIAADGSTTLGAEIGTANIYGDGTTPDVRTTIDTGIKPMYQDEFILGYERELWDGYTGGITYTYRDLGRGIEDITIDEALNLPGEFHYILANPGSGVHTWYDANHDGTLSPDEEFTFTAEELGYPDVKRSYSAVTLNFEREFDGEYYWKAQYTWSHSYGNYEGMVRSDNGQDDAGITTLYDFAGLLEGANGNLPNDRPHSLKLWGVWEFREGWQLNGAASYRSGRPKNAFGIHPTDSFAALYGAESFFNQGEFVPRGSLGRTSSVSRVDVGLKYETELLGGANTVFRLDVFNLFDFDTATEIDEVADEESGVAAATFGLPTNFQRPRTVRFGVTVDFL
jgi:outer membrane receptor for ferrienterochelin and colicin